MGTMNKVSYLFIVGIVVLLTHPDVSCSQTDPHHPPATLSASLDQNSASIGSIVTLTLRYHLPEGAYLPENPTIEGLNDLTVIDTHTKNQQIQIRLFIDQLDSWTTAPLSLTFFDKEGKTQTVTTDPVSLTVLSNLGEKPSEAQLRPIQGIIPMKPLWIQYLLWGAGVLGVLLIGTGLYIWYTKKRNKKLSCVSQPPPHLRALKEIEELEAKKLFETGYIKEFYFRLSEILKRYLENVRGFPAAESTTEEIAYQIRNNEDRVLLSLLKHADLVKFADTVPTLAKKEEEIQEAFLYIKETSPTQENEHTTDHTKGISV